MKRAPDKANARKMRDCPNVMPCSPEDAVRSKGPGQNDQPQSRDEAEEHGCQQTGYAFARTLELLPDEYTPQRGDHRRALAQTVGDGISRPARRDEVEGHADAPDHTAEHTRQMGIEPPQPVV